MSTATTPKVLRRDPAEVEPWAETCGQIRPLIEEADGAAAEVHHVEIHDAKLHYHARTDEIYHVIDGEGTALLDGVQHDLRPGHAVIVPMGVSRAITAGPSGLRYLSIHRRRGGLQISRLDASMAVRSAEDSAGEEGPLV